MMISQDIIQNVIDTADIVDVVGKQVKLKKTGANHHGCCPFHNEKTPSFVVSPAKNFYKCFGCGVSGNSITFMMEFHKLDFPTAVKELAQEYGISIPEKERTPEEIKKADHIEDIYKANAFALSYFEKKFKESTEAQEYITSRFPSLEIIHDFSICYNGLEAGMFEAAAKTAGLSSETLLAAGLIKQKDGYTYDTFIKRLIFPVISISGRVLGFTGRILEENSKYPKYLNSSENQVFNKSEILYGINLAYKIIKSTGLAYIVEGNTDVMRMHQAGFINTVAGMGTSFTEVQARILAKYAKRAVIIMDGDDAGRKSTIRTGEYLLAAGLYVSVVNLPDGQDPDSFFNEDRKDWLKENTKDFLTVSADILFSEVGIDSSLKIEAIEELSKLISLITDDSRRDAYVEDLTNHLKKFKVGKRLIQARIKEMVKSEAVQENETLDAQSLPSYLTKQDKFDFFKYGFYEGKEGHDLNQYFFGPGNRISNFIINPIFHIQDATNPRKLFELVNKYEYSVKIDIDMTEMTSLAAFRKVVEGQGNFIFEGNEQSFMKIRAKLYDNTKFCENIENLGWQRQGFWAWGNGIQTEKEWIGIDDDGIVTLDDTNYYIAAFSSIYIKDKSLFFDERKFKLIKPKIELKQWADLFNKVYKENGKIGIAFWVAATFRDHILQIFKNFPLLNLFGPKGTGKSQMAMSLCCLYGEPQITFNIHNGTKPGLADHISRFVNAISWIDEYKNGIEFDKIETLKSIYDSIGRSRMNMDKGKKKETTPVNSAVILSGQEMPTADIALFSRVIFVMFQQSEFSTAEKANYDELKVIERGGLSDYTNQLIKHRSWFEKEFYIDYNSVLQEMIIDTKDDEVEDRILRNWVTLIAAFKTMSAKIDFGFSYQELKEVCLKAIMNQTKQTSKSSEIGIFWDLIEALFDQNVLIDKWDFKIDLTDKIKTKSREIQLNPAREVLKFKFNNMAKLYREHSRRMGINPLPSDTLRYYLEIDKNFLGVSKKERFSYKEYSKEEMKNIVHESGDTTAYCFNYEKLGINLRRELTPQEYQHERPIPHWTNSDNKLNDEEDIQPIMQ